MSCILVSSQTYLNEKIVIEKMQLERNWIHVSPPFEHEGKVKALLLDGHHSLEAAKRLGREPMIDMVWDEDDGICIDLLYHGDVEWFMSWNKNDSDYYEAYVLSGDYQPVNTN